MNHFCTRPNETRLEQKRIKSVWARYARRSRAKTFSAKTDHLSMISFARVNSATLFSAKVIHLIKCGFYTNIPLKRPRQETIGIFEPLSCCNFTVNRLPGWLYIGPVSICTRSSVHKKSFSDLNEIWCAGRNESSPCDTWRYAVWPDPTSINVNVTEVRNVRKWPISKAISSANMYACVIKRPTVN